VVRVRRPKTESAQPNPLVTVQMSIQTAKSLLKMPEEKEKRPTEFMSPELQPNRRHLKARLEDIRRRAWVKPRAPARLNCRLGIARAMNNRYALCR